jgi:hypothetical protein
MKWNFKPEINISNRRIQFSFKLGYRQLTSREALVFIERYGNDNLDYWGYEKNGDEIVIFRHPLKPIKAVCDEFTIILDNTPIARLLEWLPQSVSTQLIRVCGEINVCFEKKHITLKEFLTII